MFIFIIKGLLTEESTTGKITSQHGLFYDHLIKDYGDKFAQKYLDSNERAIKEIKNIIDDETLFTDELIDFKYDACFCDREVESLVIENNFSVKTKT